MANMVDYRRAALIVGVPVGTLYDWVSKKKIPHVRLGRRLVRFDEDELLAFIHARRVAPTQLIPIAQQPVTDNK
jgi:excisionase family DNA binding protein